MADTWVLVKEVEEDDKREKSTRLKTKELKHTTPLLDADETEATQNCLLTYEPQSLPTLAHASQSLSCRALHS